MLCDPWGPHCKHRDGNADEMDQVEALQDTSICGRLAGYANRAGLLAIACAYCVQIGIKRSFFHGLGPTWALMAAHPKCR